MERFWLLNFSAADHGPDMLGSKLVCIVDEEAGGIIAYATSEEHAQMILEALNEKE